MSDETDNGIVRYSVKELLGKIDAKLDKLDAKLDEKAHAHRVDMLEDRVGRLERLAAVLLFLAALAAVLVPLVDRHIFG